MNLIPLSPILIVIISITAFLLTLLLTRWLILYLPKKGYVVQDFHKIGKPTVPMPGGPAIIAGLILSEGLLYFFIPDSRILSLVAVTTVAGIIGIVDDLKTLNGVLKPALLILASLPILLLGTYDFNLSLPFFGTVRLSILYPLMIMLAIPITTNTINSIDVLNGVASSYITIATIPVILALFLIGNDLVALMALTLFASSLAFYIFHRYPSRIFPGDSGTLALGGMYGAIVIIGEVEIVGVIALLPAILNSFFFLTSVKGFVEHRKIKIRPINILQNNTLSASKNLSAPMTLVRLILLKGPLHEKELGYIIIKLAIFSAILAIITTLAMLN